MSTETKKFVIGLENILLEVISVNDLAYGTGTAGVAASAYGSAFLAGTGSAAELLQTIGEVAEGSTQLSDEEATETKYKGDYSDSTLMSLFQRGDLSLETDIIEVDANKFALLTGGTVNGKEITIPASSPAIIAKMTVKFKQGFEKIAFPKVNLVATYSGANLRTEMFKLHLKATAVVSDGILATITTT